MTNGESKHDSDFEEDIIVTRQEEERDPEAEAEFDRELAKMMSESLDSRKFDRKPMFDVPLPMRRAQREAITAADDSGNEGGTATPPNANTMAFSLMTKKGNRQQAWKLWSRSNDPADKKVQTRTIEMPSDSHFAVAMKSQKEAERAEQQRIKNLVLNYDLQDSSTDAGTDTAISDYFSPPNPNFRHQRPAGFPLVPLNENTLAHNYLSKGLGGEKHASSHHQHNASLQQSSTSNNSIARPPDKSGTNRSGHRARKLQLSDVDWYDQKPESSRSRGRGSFPGGSYHGPRRTAG